MFAATSLLFVPGTRPDRFAKARESGAGLVVIDLEDAVPSGEKDAARAAALDHIRLDGDRLALRINALATSVGIRDLANLGEAAVLPRLLLVPMVESRVELDIVSGALDARCPDLVPLIETPRGLRSALAIARHPKVSAVMFGGSDFAGELQVPLAWKPLLHARHQLLLACAEAGVPAIDVPFVHLDDDAGLAEECRLARDIGFKAKAAIHPRQVAAIEAAFTPSAEDVAEAEDALRFYEESGGRAVRYNGRMLEAPLIKTYRALVARSKGHVNAR